MIAPATLREMIAASRLHAVKAAIVAELKRLLVGVSVVSHPGKLDIADVVAKTVVQSPGVAVGWTRIRAPRELPGAHCEAVEWVAYIVAGEHADLAAARRIDRETVAHAIGSRLLEILADPATASWGLTFVTPPAQDPAPEMRPVFTIKDAQAGAAYYAVTWTQELAAIGEPFFAGLTPVISLGADPAALDVAGAPEELLALLAGDD